MWFARLTAGEKRTWDRSDRCRQLSILGVTSIAGGRSGLWPSGLITHKRRTTRVVLEYYYSTTKVILLYYYRTTVVLLWYYSSTTLVLL